MRQLAAALLIVLLPLGAAASSFKLAGFADLRVANPPDDVGWLDGGLGKLRLGSAQGDSHGEIAQIVLEPSILITSELSVFASLRYDPHQRRDVDLMEAYVRYRPVSTTPWRWSVKLGAFYPPISLENTDTGWTSPWTLTPSAINTWVGEELRMLGAEGALEWRRSGGTLTFRAAIFEWNDPAGVLLAYRGWALGDRPTGLFDRVRLPDALATLWFAHKPMTANEFKEIDTSPGYYAGLSWRSVSQLRVELLRYDNRADPSAFHKGFAWDTNFWSAGLESPIGDFKLLAQAMTGETSVEPAPGDVDKWTFYSAYALLGRQFGVWRIAARGELFGTHYPIGPGDGVGKHFDEHGHAWTLAGSWDPSGRLRLTAEALRIESFRIQRAFQGVAPQQDELQLQLNARVFL